MLGDLHIELKPAIPVIAVGAPASIFFDEVSKRLHAEVMVPQHSEVANAVGAATAMMKLRSVLEISQGDAGYIVHSEQALESFEDPGDAISRAKTIAEASAREKMQAMGGQGMQVELTIDRVDVPDQPGDLGLVSATVIAEVVASASGGE